MRTRHERARNVNAYAERFVRSIKQDAPNTIHPGTPPPRYDLRQAIS